MRVALQTLRDVEVRDLRAIFDAAHEALAQRSCELEDLDLAEVGELAGVSAIRICQAYGLDSLSNEAFHTDVRIDQTKIADAKPLMDSLSDSFDEFADRLARNDAVDNARIARETLRRAALAYGDRMRLREVWELQELSVWVNETSSVQAKQRLASLRRCDAVQRLRLHEMYASMTKLFGLRPIEPMTIEELAEAAMSTLEGVVMNPRFDNYLTEMMRPTGPNNEMQRWSVPSTMLESLVLSSVESDPFSDIACDLAVWRSSHA